jgi:hypothetical protein
MAVDANSIENLVAFNEALPARTEDGDLIAISVKRARFFPNPRVKRNGKVLNNDEDFSCHG